MNFVIDTDWLERATISHPEFEDRMWMEPQKGIQNQTNVFLKRVIDILIALVLGLTFLPVILLSALLVRLDSPGPIFYAQERMGKDGRRITIYKFRSMKLDADRILSEHLERDARARLEWEQIQKLRDDPRVTRVGKWIREFSIDEMPQLFNILKGDMSLIGPRPILMEQKHLYGNGIDLYRSIRPGLTGLWQVSGRNRTTFHQRTLYDAYYVRNWSVLLDIYILLRTAWVVLSREGAY